MPLNSIRTYLSKLQAGESIDRPLEQNQAVKAQITKEYRGLLKTDEDRATFDQLVGTAQLVFPYVENHMFYVEHCFHSLFWNKIREFAVIMKDHGFLEDVEDVWFMQRSEIRTALWDLTTAQATHTKGMGTIHWPKEIKWRKGVFEKFQAWEKPPAVGTPPESIGEPFTIMLWGITDQTMASWAKLRAASKPEDISELDGFAASPGVVEGVARVCKSVAEINQLQQGEILVSPTTTPSWAAAFQKIQACVTDMGGIMCHAAIVCREYGVPAVVGTGQSTKFIKSGDKIRVNGDSGLVEILSRQ